MALLDDIADDFDLIDDIETVSYQRRDLEGAVTTTYLTVLAYKTATRGSLSGFGQGGQTLVDTCRWHLKTSTLAVEPRKGDRIVSVRYGTWEVLTDDTECLGTERVCVCQKVN